MFKTISFLDEEGNLQKESPEIDVKTLIQGLKIMIQTRLVDERMIILQRQGLISFALSSKGEEACSTASAAALNLQDWLYPQYRETGALFWRGFSILDYIHHMFGNAKDLLLGRQMPNHFGSSALNVVTVSSPIGTKLPHAAGAAYAMKIQKKETITLCYFGEGATSEGDFHVGLNFAAVKKVPCIFFCRNNGYAISTPTAKQFASDGIAVKGEGYGIFSTKVDGNDFFAVFDAVKKAKKLALEGRGPTLIEAMTYRMGAHSTSDDPTRYRKDIEVKTQEKLCPIKRLSTYLQKQNAWNLNLEKEWTSHIQKEIDDAIEIAKQTSKPSIETLISHVYFEVPLTLKEQLNWLGIYG